jgi:putative NADH-flavin reductase
MKIALFGATGKTGLHLLQQALDAGHEVTVLVRTPSKLSVQHPLLRVIQGDVQQADSVEEAIRGAQVVISTLGPSSNRPQFAISKGMGHILQAMSQHGVRRLIISAGAGVRDPKDRPNLVDRFFGAVLRIVSKNVVADMEQAVALVRQSSLDWTIVRVPMLTDQPPQGTLKVGYVGDTTPRIARADMAAFMLRQASEAQFIRQAPAISN